MSSGLRVGPRLCIGIVVGAHGIKGALRVKSYVDAGLTAYGPLEDEGGKPIALTVLGTAKGLDTVRVSGVTDRDAAEAWKGAKFFVPRAALPPPEEDEFYYADLVGLRVELADGTALGMVKGVADYGGGDVIAVAGPDGERMFSFTRATVPLVDVAGGRLVVLPPDEIGPEQSEGEIGADKREGEER